MATSKAKTGANAVIYVLLVIGAVIFGNIALSRVFKRFDFTEDKVYTLSQPSKDLVAKLPDKLTVKAFISGDLPPELQQASQYTRDLLDEYKNASGGKMTWEALDPAADKELEDEAKKFKVPKLSLERHSKDKLELGSSFFGIAFQYQGKIESIPKIQQAEGLEFAIDSVIKMMTVKKKKLAFADGEGELTTTADQQQQQRGGGGLQWVRQLSNQYDISEVKLGQGAKPLADDIDALIVAGPKQPMSERAKYEIDQFLMKGKPVAIFLDGMLLQAAGNGGMQMPGQDQPKIGQKNPVAMDDLLESYGFKVRDDIIEEPRLNTIGPVGADPNSGRMRVANYPTFPVSVQIAPGHPLTEKVQAMTFPFASSVEYIKDKQPGLSVTALAQSSSDAWRQTGIFVFSPQPGQQLKVGDDRGPFTFAYAASGPLKSFFAGRSHPNEAGQEVPPPAPNSSLPPGEDKPLDQSTGPARLVIIGTSNIISQEYMQFAQQVPDYGGNVGFALNLFDWLTQDELLKPIRAKNMSARPITIVSESTPAIARYANVVGVPLLFIAFGIARWQLRNSRRRMAKL